MTITQSSTRLAALTLGVAAVVAVAFGAALATPARAATICPGTTFTVNLKMGQTSAEVLKLQQFLNMSADTQIAATGAGSPGMETTYFGGLTKAAVNKFQAKYSAQILAPLGLTAPTGNWAAASRAQANVVCAGGVVVTPPPTQSGVASVSAASQPANGLAPANAVRIPFTKFTVSASAGANVVLNSVTVERQGVSSDASFNGVMLLDENGLQIGVSRTLNSNHQATIGETITIPAGTSRTFTVAANRATAANRGGEIASFAVVAVNTGAAVSGSLPITGASHTINETLSLGSITSNISSFDPNSAQTKNIGDTGLKFTGVRFTAGSSEDIRLFSIRFRQAGSVSSSDLANLVMVVNGVSYPTTVSADGKYYTALIPGGVLITKGNSVDAYLQGDIIGANSASRTIEFDIDKTSDVYVVGQLYGYGIAPAVGGSAVSSAATHGSAITTGQPWFQASTFTISGASVTTIGKANEVAAQNIAVNVTNQPLGGFVTDFKGEAVSVQQMVFSIATSSTGAGLLTNVTIVDANGKVVAGPVDASGAGTTLTFTDTVTFPVGRQVYTIKGKIPSGFTNNGTVTLSTTPSSGWTNVTGASTGNTISLSGVGAFSMNTMTVKAASLAVAVSATPSAQSIVAGGQGVLFANYQFDASQSGEDVRFSTLPLQITYGGNAGLNDLTSCQLSDGSMVLNTGSNVVNVNESATTSAVTKTFTLDNSLVIPKGTVKTIALKCNVSSSAGSVATYRWGITGTNISNISATGVTSSNTVTATGSTNAGQLMSINSGSLTVSTDASSPSYAIVAGNATGVTLGSYKFRATNEPVNLTRVGLKLTNAASSSASDLVTVYLYQGATLIGNATFVGSNMNATSTLNTPVMLAKDTDTIITVKADIAAMGTSQPATAGHLIAVDVDTAGTNTQGTGAQSGTTVNASGSTAVAGVRIFKSFPTVAQDTLATSGIADGKLLRFKVTADSHGDVGISKFSITVATTTATVTGLNIFAFTDASYSTPVSGLTADGRMLATNNTAWVSSATQLEFYAQTSAAASTTIQIPAGTTRYFEVRGSVSGATSGASISTTLLGDAAYPSLASTFVATAAAVDADSNDNVIWSPNTTGTSAVGDTDWVNGFGVVGLPSGGVTQTRSAN